MRNAILDGSVHNTASALLSKAGVKAGRLLHLQRERTDNQMKEIILLKVIWKLRYNTIRGLSL